MNRRMLAGIATAGVLALVVAVGSRRPAAGPPGRSAAAGDASGTPEARLRALLDHARAGDVDAYLDAYAEPLRSRIGRQADEAGRSAFAEELRRAAAARRGHALFAPEPDGPDAVRIAVEMVYPDRNERQVYHLERGPDGWRVAGVEAARGRSPSARYGSPATFREPEGVPVQGIAPPASTDEPLPPTGDSTP
jgi:hypothetical protein